MRRDDLEGTLDFKIKHIEYHKGIGVDVNLFNRYELVKVLVFVAYADDLDRFILASVRDGETMDISKKPEDQELIGLELTKDELIEFAAQPDQGADVFYTFPDKDIARGKAARK